MGEVTAVWKIQPHDSVMGMQEGCVHLKICRRTRIRLNIYTPLLRIKPVGEFKQKWC